MVIAEIRERPGATVRHLIRSQDRATLATASHQLGAGWPFASLVQVASDYAGRPLLLLSRLAEHTRNLERDNRVSLLFDGTGGYEQPLSGPRATVAGRIERCDDAHARARLLARHPEAREYADFADFSFYRLNLTSAHLVAGFGAVHWVDADQMAYPCEAAADLKAAEPGIVAHMNDDHRDALDLIARHLLGCAGTGWAMTGVDPEGFDLRRGGDVARCTFAAAVLDATECRHTLVGLTQSARARANG